MADLKASQETHQEPPALMDPSATLEKMQDLLRAKDDTSRFVGLALLKSVLDNGQISQDPVQIKTLWEAMSPKFLDRLLRANESQKVKREDAKDMVNLAVAVLHTFTILLSRDDRQDSRLLGRTGPLVKALIQRLGPNVQLLGWSRAHIAVPLRQPSSYCRRC